MSTYLYLECHTHEPPIRSDGEVGQHLYDLPDVREYITNRAALVAVALLNGVNLSGWASNAANFFHRHPNCHPRIVDEYGQEHPVVEPKETS